MLSYLNTILLDGWLLTFYSFLPSLWSLFLFFKFKISLRLPKPFLFGCHFTLFWNWSNRHCCLKFFQISQCNWSISICLPINCRYVINDRKFGDGPQWHTWVSAFPLFIICSNVETETAGPNIYPGNSYDQFIS